MSTTTAILCAFGVYLLLMIGIGIWSMKKTTGADDYFLGGRGLSGPVAALSAQASDMSGWLLMGLPGSVYALGTGQAWIAVGLGLGTIINWLVIARPLRSYTIVANNSMTLPEFFGNRYHDEKKILLGISSVIIVIFFLVYTASALASGGKLFNTVFGIDYHVALFIGAAVILIYTFLGGFLAVCTTDFVQGTLMLIALMIVPIVAWGFVSGDFSSLLEQTGVNSGHYMSLMYNGDHPITPVEIISNLAWGLGYCGMPHILVRFMAIKNEKELRKSSVIAITWVVISLVLAVVIGLLGRAYLFPEILGQTAGAPSTESVFIEMIEKTFTEKINLPFIGGIFICGILAAIMSTADSQLLVCSSSVSADIYQDIFKPDASDRQVLRIGRITTIVVAVIAFFIAWDPNSSIMALVSDAWAGLGAAFGPLVVMSLFWKRTNLAGAVAGLVSGAGTVLIWDYIPLAGGQTLGTTTGLYSLLVGFAVSLCFIIVVSLVTKKPDESILKEFEEYKNYKES
ncbi:MAG: sodium/proline symporter PutP [Eubacterium sp.]|nr:sodium/proline symporter PutP [Eubacterium sp.]MDD7210331.1 sodium/proline symporter PutP [Lachnospiraceae bacterium]MDY5496885.1 sodium/proline symporter PutP [Anaerobutyricum sp.]